MELEVHMLVPYLLASVYFIFQDWFQNIALKCLYKVCASF